MSETLQPPRLAIGLVKLAPIARVADAVPVVINYASILDQEPEHIYLLDR